ncbi:MAG TPA: hypothetical protein VFD58_13875 [Blastocatellia bacterium]|nr:hypothetical protein [Blastocatellia bacterium]
MTNQTGLRTAIKALPRWAALALLLSLCGPLVTAVQSPQEEEDSARRLWNKQFREARAKISKPEPPARPPDVKVKPPAAEKPEPKHDHITTTPAPPAPSPDPAEGELIGVTLWRLRGETGSDDPNKPRLLVQKDKLVAERVPADTAFSKGQFVRLGIEVPRDHDNYVYVIDREQYADGSLSEPYLIFPSKGTPRDGNLVRAGKLVYVPNEEETPPHFHLERSREDQVSERLTIIISPEPLDLPLGDGSGVRLDPTRAAQLKQWEQQWSGPTEKRELRNGAGQSWTTPEKESGEGRRRLVQNDPLPQTVYCVRVKSGGPVIVNVPLRIAP